MAVFKLTVNKEFTYRGQLEEYSNSYLFNGTTPANLTDWTAWANKIRDLEKPILPATVRFVDWYGYAPGAFETKPSQFTQMGTYAAATVGTYATGGAPQAPGDSAFWVRWWCGDYTNKGKKIYLRKYFHPAIISTGDPDHVLAGLVTAANTYAAAMYSGTGLIGTARLCRQNGDLAVDHLVGAYVTTRTLKRRSKRNPTP